MPSSSPRERAWLVGLILALLVMATPARASHYTLARVDFVSAAERRALGRAGIFDTEVLLDWTAAAARRHWLARETGIPLARLEALSARCDLLRVAGIGPNILGVLVEAGVRDTRSLARSLPAPLLARLRTAARGTPMAARLPAETTLAEWIMEAMRLRPVLQRSPARP